VGAEARLVLVGKRALWVPTRGLAAPAAHVDADTRAFVPLLSKVWNRKEEAVKKSQGCGGRAWAGRVGKAAASAMATPRFFRSVSGLWSFEYGIVDVEMIGGGCICVPDTHTEAFDDSGTLLVFVGGDFGLEGGL
jgi:hypothetical protein